MIACYPDPIFHGHNRVTQDRPALWTIFFSSPFLPQFTKGLFLLSPSQIKFVHRSASYVPTWPKPSSDGCLLKNIPSLRSGLQGLWYLDALVSSPRPWLGLRPSGLAQVSTSVGALLSITDRWPKTLVVGARSDQRRMAEGPVADNLGLATECHILLL